MATWNNAQLRLLPDEVARALEQAFGLGQDRCRQCYRFDPFLDARLRDRDEGRCARWRINKRGGDTCDYFEPRRATIVSRD